MAILVPAPSATSIIPIVQQIFHHALVMVFVMTTCHIANMEECGWDGGDCCAPNDSRPICEVSGYRNCSVSDPTFIGNGVCDSLLSYNMEECGWDGGDCCAPNDSRPICQVSGYPNCSVVDPTEIGLIGDGSCDDHLSFYTEKCRWDGGDCCAPGYVGLNCNLSYFSFI